MQDNIFALSTIIGKSGVAVIRVSGPDAFYAAEKLGVKIKLTPNQARFVKIYSLSPDASLIDECVILYFKAPHSFTGEDVIEFQTHGSIAVIKELLEELGKLNNFRPAEPGEFAKRAFFNNKLDLTQAEGLVELIESETRIQKQIALRQISGELKNLYENWRLKIISILAQLEAYIDFPDDDIPPAAITNAKEAVSSLIEHIEYHLQDNRKGEILLRGVRVAIAGSPNVGKSSLLNCLAKRDVAIVSGIAGTTRDVLEVKLDLEGYPFILYDTAGIRDSSDVIEQEGVRRAKSMLSNADICILVVDGSDDTSLQILEYPKETNQDVILVINKVDLAAKFKALPDLSYKMIKTSMVTQEGVEELMKNLLELAQSKYSLNSDPILTQVRYRKHLENCLSHLKEFATVRKSLELMAEDVRLAASSLGAITGKIDIEEILDEIFSTFCIGK